MSDKSFLNRLSPVAYWFRSSEMLAGLVLAVIIGVMAGLGAAMFLSDEGFALAEKLASRAQPVDLGRETNFDRLFVDALEFKASLVVEA